MKLIFLIATAILFIWINSHAQTVEHAYRFTNNLLVSAPTCAADLVQAKALGSCPDQNNPGSFVDDVLTCGVRRKVYHTNLNYGLRYENTEGAVAETYTIQMYIKNTSWGKDRVRIIDFSDGQLDQGIYFRDIPGTTDRCLDFSPNGISGACPFFNTTTYYLLTFTRDGQTGILDIYVNNTLLVSYNDSDKKYVAKAGTPIYVYRDDSIIPCESGEANLAYLYFSNYYSPQAAVSKAYREICTTSSVNVMGDFSISPNPSCGNADIIVTYTGILPSSTGYTFKWDFNGAKILSGSGRGPYTLRWNSIGTKSVTLRVINDLCGKELINTKQTVVSYTKISTALDEKLCQTTASLTINTLNGISPFQFSIDSVHYQSSNVFSVISRDYKIFVKDYNGCVSDTLIKVDLKGTIQLQTLTDTTLCFGQNIQLSTTGNVSDYSWSPAIGLDNASIKDPVASPEQTTQYIVTAKDKTCSTTDTVTVRVIPEIKVIVTPNSEITANEPFQLNASSTQLSGISSASFEWSPPYGLDNAMMSNPVATLTASQLYTVTVSTPQGCRGEGTVLLTVNPPSTFLLPNAFTPDGDGKNDLLLPVTIGITSLNYFMVYNRWGQVMYSSKSLTEGWDGRVKGIEMGSGTYVWKVEAVTNSGKIINKTGNVLLIR